MNDLCADIGYKSINHVGEELCGDHIDIVEDRILLLSFSRTDLEAELKRAFFPLSPRRSFPQ